MLTVRSEFGPYRRPIAISGHSSLHIPVAVYGANLSLLSLISLLQLRYLARHPELSHDQLTPSWVATYRTHSDSGDHCRRVNRHFIL